MCLGANQRKLRRGDNVSRGSRPVGSGVEAEIVIFHSDDRLMMSCLIQSKITERFKKYKSSPNGGDQTAACRFGWDDIGILGLVACFVHLLESTSEAC